MSDRGTITLPREVGEHLMWVLEECPMHGDWEERDCVALNALRTALAAEQPKPEPVAWFLPQPLEVHYYSAKNQALQREVEALRRDAERYRWMKAKVEDYDGHACFPQVPYPAPIPDRSPFDAVDAAIDAAMGEKR